jgi:hypothetical protein
MDRLITPQVRHVMPALECLCFNQALMEGIQRGPEISVPQPQKVIP